MSLISLAISTAVLADQKSPHSVGLQVGVGGIEYQGSDAEGTGVGTSYLYYNYNFMPNYTIELGLLGSSDFDWKCDEATDGWDCYSNDKRKNDFVLDADKFELNATVIALKSSIALSKRNSLYGKVGASYYDYEMILNGDKTVNETGIGFMLEGGWQYRWDTGMGMNTGLQYQKMGDLKSSNLNVGISYSF